MNDRSQLTDVQVGDKVLVAPGPGEPNFPGLVVERFRRRDLELPAQPWVPWARVEYMGDSYEYPVRKMFVRTDVSDMNIDPDDQIATWDEDYEAVVEAIESGWLDKHLQEIVKAGVDRYKEISNRDMLVKAPAKTPARAKSKRTVKAQPAFPGLVNLLRPASVPLVDAYVFKADPDAHRSVRYKGSEVVFAKSSFMGKAIKIMPWSLEEDAYDGLRVKVTGMGPKMMKVDFIDPPPPNSGYGRKIAKDMPCFLAYKVLLPYLDIN